MRKGRTKLTIALLSLVVAVITYFFAHNEVVRTTEATDPSYKLIKPVAKKLPVKLRLVSSTPKGYRILDKEISTRPTEIIVIGPEAMLEAASTVETALLDVSEATQTVRRTVPLDRVAGMHLSGEPYPIEVVIPIEKVDPLTDG
ncbi:MAG: hypothetical protein MOGMAGMI_01413 [Candidatus Omnitrophica bacterium]|nr:hypothetical protein [Candidatus Omnitrophota bacterium]